MQFPEGLEDSPLTGMAYLLFFDQNASSEPKSILETNKTSFASYLVIHWYHKVDQILTYTRQMLIWFLLI